MITLCGKNPPVFKEINLNINECVINIFIDPFSEEMKIIKISKLLNIVMGNSKKTSLHVLLK